MKDIVKVEMIDGIEIKDIETLQFDGHLMSGTGGYSVGEVSYTAN